jgi:DNA-binding XRE family transcriptional regulator
MVAPTGTEEIIYEAVKAGWIEIGPDGAVWRIAQRRKSRWDGRVTVRPVKAHRIDPVVGVGYRLVKIMIDGRQTSTPAHRLVWRHFKGAIPDRLTINHKNGIKHENRPSNLELATNSDQMRHAYRTGLKDEHGQKNPNCKLTDGRVEAIRTIYAAGTKTQAELAHIYGVTFQTISKIVRGDRRKRQGGPQADYSNRRQHPNQTRNSKGQFRS